MITGHRCPHKCCQKNNDSMGAVRILDNCWSFLCTWYVKNRWMKCPRYFTNSNCINAALILETRNSNCNFIHECSIYCMALRMDGVEKYKQVSILIMIMIMWYQLIYISKGKKYNNWMALDFDLSLQIFLLTSILTRLGSTTGGRSADRARPRTPTPTH